MTDEADHKVFSGHQKGLGTSITVLILDEDGNYKCANFPLSITPVDSHETTSKDNGQLLQKVIQENEMVQIAKELF